MSIPASEFAQSMGILPQLLADPRQFPHSLSADSEQLLLIRLTQEQIHQSSFLDHRIITPDSKGVWLSFDELTVTTPNSTANEAAFIFHIGHVGSTLISRLIGTLSGVLAIREPQILRDLTGVIGKLNLPEADWSPEEATTRTKLLCSLLSRTFAPEQRAVIKATSFVSEIASKVTGPQTQMLFLYVPVLSYMQTILAGEASLKELSILTAPRLRRLAQRVDPMPFRRWSMSLGARVALGWAAEMLALDHAASVAPPASIMWMNFDSMLESPGQSIAAVAEHFGIEINAESISQLDRHPLMSRYSKALDHEYSVTLRQRLKLQAAQHHRQAISEGEAWLKELATRSKTLSRILDQRG